ncbi:MAG: hypothetical protein EOO61_10290 [Hymenobacter sp.]|nr:MAG: hypothetical protein EOO61_10290 [Hymenobacter sp.]
MKFFVARWVWLLLLGVGSGCTEQAPTTSAQHQPAITAPSAPASRPTLPARQEVRVNDTLVLECTRPFTTLPLYQEPALVMWSQMALRGRRGYYEVLNYPDTLGLYCLYQCQHEALVSARGDVLHFSVLEPGRLPGDEARRGQPLPHNAVYALDREVWDVRYRQYTGYVTADLKDLERGYAPCFTGVVSDLDEEYRLLPDWIGRERASLKRLHRLPPARRLLAYSNLSRETATETLPRYIHGYGPLLLNLLHAWRAYPMPIATARHLDRSIYDLSTALRRKRRPN